MTDEEYEYLFRDADPRWKAYYRTRREEYRKEHPCTNFERWKEGLKPEHYADIKLFYSGCSDCPARLECACCFCKDRDACTCSVKKEKCRANLIAWANAPAEEEE